MAMVVSWKTHPLAADYPFSDLAFGKGRYVGVGDGGLIAITEPEKFQMEVLRTPSPNVWQGQVIGLPSTNCVVEVSTNLTDWQVLTNITSQGNSALYIDPEASMHPWRFYRSKTQ